MYLFSLTTYPNRTQKEDDYSRFKEEQDWYFGTLAKNGQILMEGCNTIQQEEQFITYFLSPETDSLDSKYENNYVQNFYKKLLELCREEPDLNLLGKSTDYTLSCCCASPSWYMLYSDYATHDSPVVCGDCGLTVPLYKLPKILQEDEYFSVLGWQKAYNACDRLFMEGFGEKFAYQRLTKPTSDLGVFGRKICTCFENATQKPFYYYLFRYHSPHKPTCPICNQNWKLENNTSFIDFRCDACRLVGDKIKPK